MRESLFRLMPSSPQSRLNWLPSWLVCDRQCLQLLVLLPLAAWVAFNWIDTTREVLRYYTPLPIWDYWRVAQYLNDYKSFHIGVLWIQHNEHRIVFPEIVFAIDMLVFHGRQMLPLTISFLCQFSIWAVVARTLLSDKQLSQFTRNIAILLSGVVIGWKGSAPVLGWAFLLQWTLTELAACLSFYFLFNTKEKSSQVFLAATIACGVVANYSSGNGLGLWPLLLIAAFILALDRRQIVILSIAAVLSIGMFFVGYRSSHDLHLLNILKHPVYFVSFLASYVSMPFGAKGPPSFGLFLGLVNLGTFLLILIVCCRRGLIRSCPAIVLLGSYAFTLVTAGITAAGRMDPADVTYTAAKAARYVSVPLATWGIWAAVLIWLSNRRAWRIASAGLLSFVIGAFFLYGFLRLRQWVQVNEGSAANQELAAVSLENGIFDPQLIKLIFPDPGFVGAFLPELRKDHLSIYSGAGPSNLLGQDISSRFRTPPQAIQGGEISQIFPVNAGLEVVGWTDGAQRANPKRTIFFVNQSGKIVGFGKRLGAGFPSYIGSYSTPTSIGYVGFVSLAYKTQSFSAYLTGNSRRGLIPISPSVESPQMRIAAPADLGPSISNLHWQTVPAWSRNAIPAEVSPGPYRPQDFFSTWDGSDANTGHIVSSEFTPPVNNCLILPVLHGPSIGGLSVNLLDADINKLMKNIPMQGGETGWRLWRIPVDRSVQHLKIVAVDEGNSWGQWLAIGQPSGCK